jgi:hypothetical protein
MLFCIRSFLYCSLFGQGINRSRLESSSTMKRSVFLSFSFNPLALSFCKLLYKMMNRHIFPYGKFLNSLTFNVIKLWSPDGTWQFRKTKTK